MSTSPSNLRLALEAYDAQQRRQAALLEAERIGTLIHIQEQQLLAAKHLAKQRKSQRRRRATTPTATTTTTAGLAESAVDDEEEDSESAASAPTPIPASLAARRAARSAAKRASLLPPMPVLESIPEPEFDEHSIDSTEAAKSSQIARFASHKRRPNEPYAALASRSQWKPDSHARVCDNVLCRTPFTLFGPITRHHCRRCGNVFCAACLTHTEVLYDMEHSKWDRLPEALLASIFPSEPSPAADQHQQLQQDKLAVPTSPASSNLSSSLESGSSRASSSSSYFASQPCLRQPISDPLHTVHRVPRWRSGTDEVLPTPIPAELRDQLLDIATEEKVCEECHDELWDQPTPFERHNARRAFNREREEMAWALTVLGLDKWDETLREHDLTLKPMPRERKEKKFRRGSSHSSGTVTTAASSAHASSTSSTTTPHWSVPVQGSELPAGVPGIKPEEGLDYLDRPTYPHVYAWVTPPTCIRFTSGAFKSASSSSSSATHPYHAYHHEQQIAPSPFGMLKSPAKFLPPPLPASYLAAQAVQAAQAAAARVPTGEEREDLRQHAYKAAVKDFVRAAYLKGVPCDHLDGGVMGVRFVVDPTPMQALRSTMEKKALDLAARWRGDPVGDA